MTNSLQDLLKRLRAPPPLRPPLRPPDVTHVMNRTRPSAFFAALQHPCIIVNGNRRTEKNGVGLGTRLASQWVWFCTILMLMTFSAYDNGRSTDIFRSISLYVRSITHLSCKFVRTSSVRSFTRLVLSACAEIGCQSYL